MDHGQLRWHGRRTWSKRFRERVRFDNATPSTTRSRLTPAVSSVKHDDVPCCCTRSCAATIGALITAAEARGIEPRNLGVRRATLEDVFLDLTGRAMRD
jgi:hypothetical protein